MKKKTATSKNGRAWRPVPLSKKAQRERIEKLKREQGEKPTGDQILNAGPAIQLSDEEFAEFMSIIQRMRRGV